MSNTLASDEPSEASPLLRDPEINDGDHEDGQISDNGAPTRMYSDRKMHLILASVGIGVWRSPFYVDR